MHSGHRQSRNLTIDTSLASRSGHGKLPARTSTTIRTAKSLSSSGNLQHLSYSDTAAQRRAPGDVSAAHRANESFLESSASPNSEMNDQRDSYDYTTPRDSHDLSLSPQNVTRDSFVTNMLMSFDQFSTGETASRTAPDPTYDQPQFSFDEERSRTNTITASKGYAMDQPHAPSDAGAEYDPSRVSSQGSRERRSNSSSNHPSGYTRLDRVPEGTRQFQHGQSGSQHTRGGKNSKSSSTTTVDAMHEQHHTILNRPASFEQSNRPVRQPPKPPQMLPQQQQSHQYVQTQQSQQSAPMSPFHVEFPNIFAPDDLDAAPTPTVHGGPRRVPASNPPPPPEPPKSSKEERKRSASRSAKGQSGKKGNSGAEIAPPLPSMQTESAPAPSVGYGKPKDAPANGLPVPSVKERPGFFRRVFGGGASSKSQLEASDSNPGSRYGSTSEPNDATRQLPNGSAPPSRDTSSSHSHHPTLQKKPSSFFRRRRKSVHNEQPPAQEPAPPVPPISIVADKEKMANGSIPSPVSSLRKVMNPYIRNNPGARESTSMKQSSPLQDISNTPTKGGQDRNNSGGYQREFSPDYEPSPNAKIRTVRSELATELPIQSAGASPSPIRPSMRNKENMSGRNDSFLNLDGGSDNEGDVPTHSQSPVPPKSKHRKVPKAAADSPVRKNSFRDQDATLRAKPSLASTTDQAPPEDPRGRPNLALPIEGVRSGSPASASTETDYKSAASQPPSLRLEPSTQPSPKVLGSLKTMQGKPLDEPEFVIGEPTEDDRQKAQKIYDGNEDFIQQAKAAAWMGEEGPVRQRTLQAYMELYDFTAWSIGYSLRQVCGRLVLRAETQQVDRILVAFSARWRECNPNHGFKVTDVIHTICYSIMLLNTDLHMADIEQKMTRSQFVKNTMTTILQAVLEAAPDAFDRRPSVLPEKGMSLSVENTRPSVEQQERKSFRHSFRPPPRLDSSDYLNDCGPLVKTPFEGSMKAWEEQVELVLKAIYSSIRDERLPLFGANPERMLNNAASQSSLSVIGMLKRSPSVLSKAPSESQTSSRGRINEPVRPSASRWSSKSRSRTGLGRTGFSSSRTSFDDGNSVWSPALSSATWSRQSLGRTQTSVSQDSFGSSMRRPDYQQSIGFANALSQAIIRDEDALGNETAPSVLSAELPVGQLLDDESLELAGPPWVKEGMVIHKHHLHGVDKKARDRNWSEVFAVIQKGQMSLFSFNASKSMRHKQRLGEGGRVNAPVGGGNWQDNATNVGTFNLRQTLASALPPPGYSRARPHVWALSLPTGAVHLFQVGTPEIIKEFVTTANYWSARLSTHPLIGGISNIEYGWSDAVVNNALVSAINETSTLPGKTSRPGSATTGHRSSVQSGSFRSSSFDQGLNPFTHNSGRGKLPGDRIHVAAWTSPTQSMRPSCAPELEQLETLKAYVQGIEDDLQTHNQLRSPMLLAFTPRGANAAKAMANWERKSAYLLREIVKFRTYVDSLQAAEVRKNDIHEERSLAQRAARGELSDGDMDVSTDDENDVTLRP